MTTQTAHSPTLRRAGGLHRSALDRYGSCGARRRSTPSRRGGLRRCAPDRERSTVAGVVRLARNLLADLRLVEGSRGVLGFGMSAQLLQELIIGRGRHGLSADVALDYPPHRPPVLSISSTSARRRTWRSSSEISAARNAVTISAATSAPITRPPRHRTLTPSCSTAWWAV